ncbi:MAG TPA: methyltransferase domain-containing protein [Gaiellaceae bacterium]|nr:methyltransferase domain-containing protein [Gaiellaceae bacterium]
MRRLAAKVSARSRRRKLELFLTAMQPTAETTVVDVGVSDGGYGEDTYGTANFFEALYPWPERIVAVSTQHLTVFQEAFPKVTAVRADGRALPFLDDQFDIGFSNAVVEHLPDLDSQRAFVSELCRVSRRVFVTTPNRRFPLDTHTLVPLAHWLSDGRRDGIYRKLGRDEGLGLRLLGPDDFLALFPASARPRLVQKGMTLVAVAETASA